MHVNFFKIAENPFIATIERKENILPHPYYVLNLSNNGDALALFFDKPEDLKPLSDAIHCMNFGYYPNGQKTLTVAPSVPVELEDYGY